MHALHESAPKASGAAPASGRVLDQIASKAASALEPPPLAKAGVASHADDPHEYEFWVNVAAPATGLPAVCVHKGLEAPGYQVVIPKARIRAQLRGVS